MVHIRFTGSILAIGRYTMKKATASCSWQKRRLEFFSNFFDRATPTPCVNSKWTYLPNHSIYAK